MNRINNVNHAGRALLAAAVLLALPAGAQQPRPRNATPTGQQGINAANQVSSGNTMAHQAAWFLSGLLPTGTTTDAVNQAAQANSGGRRQNQNIEQVNGQQQITRQQGGRALEGQNVLNAGSLGGTSDGGAVVVGMLGNSDNPQTILGNSQLRDALINGANNPNSINVSGGPPVRNNGPTRPPGIYTSPLDGSAPQLIVPQTMVVNGRTVTMVGSDGRLTNDGLQVLQQQNAAADAQLQAYQATRDQRLAELRAQNAADARARSGADTVANAAAAPTTGAVDQPSIPDGPGYPLARPRTRTNSGAAAANAGQSAADAINDAIEAALDPSLDGTVTGDLLRADGEPGEVRYPWDEYAGDLMSDDMLDALISMANALTTDELADALDTGCPGGPCGSADAFSRGPYDQTQLPSVRSGPLPMFNIGEVPSGQTMSVAELLPIYAGYDPWASGTVMRSLDLFPPTGISSVGWSPDLYPPTGVSSVGWSLDLFPPTGVSSVGWSLDLYPPTYMSLAGDVLWSRLNGTSGSYGDPGSSMLSPFNPLLNDAWRNNGQRTLTADELARIAAGMLADPDRVSAGAGRVGNLTGLDDNELLRLASTDLGGLRSLLAQPFNVLLTWGAGAYDLDLHMTGPLAGDRFHVYFSDRGSQADAPYAELIRDCVCTNGSEVILTSTLNQGGVYRVSVFNYGDQSADSTALGTPSANVQLSIVRGGEAVGVGQGTTIQNGTTIFSGTPSGGAGNTWRAVEINPANGRIFFVDQIVQSGSSDSVQ